MSPDQQPMTPEQIAQQAAAQVRAEMEQAPQLSPHLEMVREALTLAALHEYRAQTRGNAVLQIAARLDERAAEAAQQPAAPQEAPVIEGRPPGGIIVHEPPAPGESAQEKAEAEHAANEEARQAAIHNEPEAD